MISTISMTNDSGVKNSPPFCTFGTGKVAQEVLINLPEPVARLIDLEFAEPLQEDFEGCVVNLLVLRLEGVP